MDCTKAGTWVEIDAVEMVGTRFNFGKFQPKNIYPPKPSKTYKIFPEQYFLNRTTKHCFIQFDVTLKTHCKFDDTL